MGKSYAQYYDVIWKTQPDENWLKVFLDQKPKGTLVDLGCGTGRVLRIALEQGWKAIGIDSDQKMLEMSKNNLALFPADSFTLIDDDFCNVAFDGNVELITCMTNTFCLILEKEKRMKLLKKVHEKLCKGGKFLLWLMMDNNIIDKEKEVVFPIGEGELIYRAKTRLDHQRMIREVFFEFEVNGHIEKCDFETKMIPSSEMIADLQKSGFVVARTMGNFDSSELHKNSPFQIYELEKIYSAISC